MARARPENSTQIKNHDGSGSAAATYGWFRGQHFLFISSVQVQSMISE